jgi:hypothetical protein
MSGRDKYEYEEIFLSKDQLIAYNTICNELIARSKAVFDRSNVDVFLPRKTCYWPIQRDCTHCLVSNEKIMVGEEAIIIFTLPVGNSMPRFKSDQRKQKKIILGVFKEEAFFHLLSLGSFAAFKVYKKEKRREERGELPPRPMKIILPHQEVCHCVQCGKRIVRPEEMSVEYFAKIYRCNECQEAGVMMKMGETRYCKRCGTRFTPAVKTHKLCPWCRSDPTTK